MSNWKSKYSGMDVSQVKRLKELEENRKLKQMYTDLALDNWILLDVIGKTLEPEIKKQIALEMVEEYELSIARACKLMEIHRSYYYYQEKRDDMEVGESIRTAAQYDMVPELCGRCPGYTERFNGSNRRAVFDAYIYRSIEEVKRLVNPRVELLLQP